MKKRIVSFVTAGFVAMGLLFSLASCSQEGDTNNTYIFPYNYSCNDRLSAQDFSKSVEGGAEVDKSLMDGDSYEKFFNNSDLIATLKTLFGAAY